MSPVPYGDHRSRIPSVPSPTATPAARIASSDAARFVGRDVHDLVVGAPADVVLVDAENVPDAVVRAPRRALVVAGGRVVARDGAVLV